MWIKVISLRSPTIKLLSVMAVLIISVMIFNTPAPQKAAVDAPFANPVYRVITSQRAMALTVNVVWGTQYVPKMLALLHQNHVAATFMVGGVWAQKHPNLVRQMVKDGMEVGNHGWNHGHPANMSVSENVLDIEKTNETVQRVANVLPRVYAPPYGELGPSVINASAKLHMPLVMWTIDTIDWRPSSQVPYIVNKVIQKAKPGAIVLMHPTDRSVLALGQIIQGLKQEGYQFVTVSHLMKMGTPATDE